MAPIKIFRLVNRFNLGGITYNVSNLSRYLQPTYETLLAGGPEEKNEASSLYIPQSLGLQPLIIPEMRRSLNPVADYKAYKKLRRLIREYRPDIVHTHASKAGAIGRLAAIHERVPVIVHTFHGHVFHSYFGKFKTAVYKSIERYLAKRSSALIAISNSQKEELWRTHRICDQEKIKVICLGFDLLKFTTNNEEKRHAFRQKYNISDDVLAIGIVGRLAPVKNHGLFVDAVAACKKNNTKKIMAIIIGDGESGESIRQHIIRQGLTFSNGSEPADFVFTSWIREVDQALPGLDLVCLTSRNEGTPVSLIEAQAASKFIVSTNVGGVSDILHKDCGLLSPAGDSGAFIANLQEAVTHFERYAAGAGRASAEVIQKFSYTRLCSEMDKLYRELLHRSRTAN